MIPDLRIYKPKSNIFDFLNKMNRHKPITLSKKDNFIDFDYNFYKKANLVFDKNIAFHIYNTGVENGLLFHPKQLMNYKNVKIYEDNK